MLASIDRTFGKIEMAICLLALSAIVIATSLGVFFRYALNSPLIWSNEVGMLSLLWLTFFGASLLYRERGHIAVDIVSSHLPAKARQILITTTILIMAAAIAIVGWKMLTLIPLQHKKTITALDIPRSAYGVPVLWMAVAMLIASIRQVFVPSLQEPNSR